MFDPMARAFTPSTSASSYGDSVQCSVQSSAADVVAETGGRIVPDDLGSESGNWQEGFTSNMHASRGFGESSFNTYTNAAHSNANNAQQSEKLQHPTILFDPHDQYQWQGHGRAPLKLAPSPDPHKTPTHRSAMESKNQDKLLGLIRNGVATERSETPIAVTRTAEHNTAHKPLTNDAQIHQQLPASPGQRKMRTNLVPLPLKLDAGKAAASASSEPPSPKKKLFSKLTFGFPALKPSAPILSKEDPVKTSGDSLMDMPPKAAQVLGTQSMPSRTSQANTSTKDDSYAFSPSSKYKGAQHNSTRDLLQYPEPRLRTLNARISSGNLHEPFASLRFYDDDIPPTPPSKTSMGSDFHIPGKSSSIAATNADVHGSKNPGKQSPAKTGVIPKFPAQVVDNPADTRSMYGTFGFVEHVSPSPNPPGRGSSPSSALLTSGRVSRAPASSPSLYSYTDPGKNNLGHHKSTRSKRRLLVQPQAPSGVPNPNGFTQGRKASNSTSASVPLFFEGITTENSKHRNIPELAVGQAPAVTNQTSQPRASQTLHSMVPHTDNVDMTSIIEKAMNEKLGDFANQISAKLERMSHNIYERLDGIDRGLFAVKGQMRKLERRKEDVDTRVDTLESLMRQTGEGVDWLQNHAGLVGQGGLRSHTGERYIQSSLHEQDAILTALREDYIILQHEVGLQQPHGQAQLTAPIAAMGVALGSTATQGPQEQMGASMESDSDEGMEAGQRFPDLENQASEPQLWQHPYYNQS